MKRRDQSHQLSHYVQNIALSLETGRINKKKLSASIDALVEALNEVKSPYLENIPDGMKTLGQYMIKGIDLYMESLAKIKSYLSTPSEKLIKESVEHAESASMILSNVGIVLEENEMLLKVLANGEIEDFPDRQ